MNVYFVRHGESVYNKEFRHQLPDTPLSSEGVRQAEAIARRFSNIPLDVILTSTYTRALETARTIEKEKSVPLTQNNLLVERRTPSVFRGKLHNDPEIASIHESIRENFYTHDWHYSDEENFSDIFSRAQNALELIETQNKDNIAVVSHGFFLTVMIFYILFGEEAHPQSFTPFRKHTEYSNTGLTMCEFKDGEWRLLTLNDHAHLGE